MNPDVGRDYMMSVVMYMEAVPSQLGNLLAVLCRSLVQAVPAEYYSIEACQDSAGEPWSDLTGWAVDKCGTRMYDIKATHDEHKIIAAAQLIKGDAIYATIESWRSGGLRWPDRFDWMISWSAANSSSVQSFGHCVLVNIRLSTLASREFVLVDNLVRGVWRACDQHGYIVSGLVDVCHALETSDGLAYHQLSRAATWHRTIERQLCQSHRDDLARLVRGVYWGSVIGARAMAQIGSVDIFVSEFNQLFERKRPRPSDIVHKLSSGGLFVQLSSSIRDVWPNAEWSRMGYEDHVVRVAGWLRDYLRRRGLLM